MYRAKTEKHKSESRRKETQKIQVIHNGKSGAGKGRGLQPISSAFPSLLIDKPEEK